VLGGPRLIDTDPVGMFPWGIALHPSGAWLYVSDWSAGGRVSAFAIGADGTLTALAGSPFALPGSDAIWVAPEPGGRWLYASTSDDDVYGFAIDPATGALSLLPSAAWPANSSGPWVVAIEPTGRFGYIAPDTSGGVPGFTIDPATGALTTTPGSKFASGAIVAFSASIDATGRRLFLANQGAGTNTLTAYAIDPVTGALAHLPGSPVDTTPWIAFNVTASPFTDDVYVGTDDASPIWQFRATASGITPVRGIAVPGLAVGGRMVIVGAQITTSQDLGAAAR